MASAWQAAYFEFQNNHTYLMGMLMHGLPNSRRLEQLDNPTDVKLTITIYVFR